MINITKPIMDIRYIVPRTEEKSLDNNLRDRNNVEPMIDNGESKEKKYDYDVEDLKKAVESTNRMFFGEKDHYEFKIHEGTGRIMVRLIDNDSGEVIKEVPPEKILDLVAGIWELVGILVDKRG